MGSFGLVTYESGLKKLKTKMEKAMCGIGCNLCPKPEYLPCELHPDDEETCERCKTTYCFMCKPEHPKECRTGKYVGHISMIQKQINIKNSQLTKQRNSYRRFVQR